jgi:hypothetical protein
MEGITNPMLTGMLVLSEGILGAHENVKRFKTI